MAAIAVIVAVGFLLSFEFERAARVEQSAPMSRVADDPPARVVSRQALDGRAPVLPAPPDEESVGLESGRLVTVHVTDLEARPLQDSEVYLVPEVPDASTHRFMGRTDAGGVLSIALLEDVREACVVRRSGYVPERVPCGEADADLRVRLRPAAILTGQVVWQATSQPVSGVAVVGWPTTGGEPPWGALCRGDFSHPECLVAVTEDDGTFTLEGLDAAGYYTLTAADRGVLQVDPVPFVRPGEGDGPVILEVARLFAVAVQLLDESGGPIRSDERLLETGPNWEMQQTRAGHVSPTRAELCLAGLDRSWTRKLGAHPGFNATMLLATGDHREERLGPVILSVKRPGYEEAHEELWAEPITDGVEVHEIRLTREEAAAFGSLAVVVHAPTGFLGVPRARLEEIAMLSLRSETATYTLDVDVEMVNGPPLTLDGVPAGEYHVDIAGANGWFVAENGPVYVNAGQTAAVDLVLPALGEIHVQVLDGRGVAHDGFAMIKVLRPWAGGFSQYEGVGFGAPPYVLNGLPPGEYTVVLGGSHGESMPASDGALTDRMQVQVAAGHVTTALLARSW